MAETKPATQPNQKGLIPPKIMTVLTVILSFVGMAETYVLLLPADNNFRSGPVAQLIHYFSVALKALIQDGVVIAPPAQFGIQLEPEHLEGLQLAATPDIVAGGVAAQVTKKGPAKKAPAKDK
jgi:hypothetical protein